MESTLKIVTEIAAKFQKDHSGLSSHVSHLMGLERAVSLIELAKEALTELSAEQEVRLKLFDATTLTVDEFQARYAAVMEECQIVNDFLNELRQDHSTSQLSLVMNLFKSYGVSEETTTTFLTELREELG